MNYFELYPSEEYDSHPRCSIIAQWHYITEYKNIINPLMKRCFIFESILHLRDVI